MMYRGGNGGGGGPNTNSNGYLLTSLNGQALGVANALQGSLSPQFSKNNINGFMQGVQSPPSAMNTVGAMQMGNSKVGQISRPLAFSTNHPSSPQSQHDNKSQLLNFPLSPLSRNSAPSTPNPPSPAPPNAAQDLGAPFADDDELKEEEARLFKELSGSLQVPDENAFARWQAAHRNKILKEASVKLASLQAAQSYVESRIDSDHATCNGVLHVPKIAEPCKYFRMACGCTRTQCPYEHGTTLKAYLYENKRNKTTFDLTGRNEVKLDQPVVFGQRPPKNGRLSQQQKEAITLITNSNKTKVPPGRAKSVDSPPMVAVKTEDEPMVMVKTEDEPMIVVRTEDDPVVVVKTECDLVVLKTEDDDEDDDGCFVVNFGGFPNGRQRTLTPTPPPPEPASPTEVKNENKEHALALLQACRLSAPKPSSKQIQRDALDRQLEEFQKRTPGSCKRSKSEESQESKRRKR